MIDEFSKAELWHDLQLLGQAIAALVLGGIVGWEREASNKWAGLRTHMLVCFASMLLVAVGQALILDAQARFSADILRIDPVRMIEAIVAGIAFLGAGTIFRDSSHNRMHGLTTAASLLAVAPIGVAVAIGRYVLAFGATLLILFVLRTMRVVESRMLNKDDKSADS